MDAPLSKHRHKNWYSNTRPFARDGCHTVDFRHCRWTGSYLGEACPIVPPSSTGRFSWQVDAFRQSLGHEARWRGASRTGMGLGRAHVFVLSSISTRDTIWAIFTKHLDRLG
jgi:hypothetical protein